jgi:dethiobiotin synthetase
MVAVVGTGTGVGKTWVTARLLTDLRAAGLRVASRKPAQSFEPGDDPAARDAAVLGAATGEPAEEVCPPHRWYDVAMAPPMAAESLGRPPFTIQDLTSELRWPADAVDVGLVETAGGVRSPLAADGDCLALCAALDPDVVLNRFDGDVDVQVRNIEWLRARDALVVLEMPGRETELVDLVSG